MYKQKMNISDGKVHVTTLILSDEEPCLCGTTSTMCIAYERQLKRPTILDFIFRDGFHKKVDIETTPQDLVGHHSTSCVLSYSILSMANLEGK